MNIKQMLAKMIENGQVLKSSKSQAMMKEDLDKREVPRGLHPPPPGTGSPVSIGLSTYEKKEIMILHGNRNQEVKGARQLKGNSESFSSKLPYLNRRGTPDLAVCVRSVELFDQVQSSIRPEEDFSQVQDASAKWHSECK